MELKPIVYQKVEDLSAPSKYRYDVYMGDTPVGVIYHMVNKIHNFYPVADIICLTELEFKPNKREFPDNLVEVTNSIKKDFNNFLNTFYGTTIGQ